jgi:hypothetical protein
MVDAEPDRHAGYGDGGHGDAGAVDAGAAIALPRAVPPIARRWRLGVAGMALGLSLGAKWSVLPLAALIMGC